MGQPPLRSRDDVEAMWSGVLDGSIEFIATDHAPWTRAQKLDPELTITRLRPGVSNLQHMLPMFYSEGVRSRRLPLERFVALYSTVNSFSKLIATVRGRDEELRRWPPRIGEKVLA